MEWDDDDAWVSSVNWEAQEAQAARSRQARAALAGPSGLNAGVALPGSYALQQQQQQQAPAGGVPQAGGPPGAGLRSLFWSGNSNRPGHNDAQQQQQTLVQSSHSGPQGPGRFGPLGGGHLRQQQQQQQQQPSWQAGPHGGAAHQAQGRPGQWPPNPPQYGPAEQLQHCQQQGGYSAPLPGQGPYQQPAVQGPDSGGFLGQGGPPLYAGGSGGMQQQQQQQAVYQQQQPAASGGMLPNPAPGGPGCDSGGTMQQQPGAGSGSGLGPVMHGSLSLGHDRQLQLQLGYHDAVKAVLTRLQCGWDSTARMWRFPIAHHDRVLEELGRVRGVRVRVEPLHQVPMAVIQASLACPDDSDRYCHISANLEAQLMPFQREGVKFALRHGGRALIGDEMGLGKTVQAIAVAAAYRDEWPVLIIAPSSLREQWADALHRWLGVTEDHIHVVHNNKDAMMVPNKLQFLIASYNFVPKMDLEGRFKMIILDESHYIKDHSAQRTKATVPLLRAAKRVILLTGTPALNKPKEIFQQLAALVPLANLKMKHFGERYCTGNRFDKYGGACNLAELNALLKGTVMVRRLKKEVLTQLPKKRRQQVYLTLDGDAKRQLQGLQQQLSAVKDLFASLTRQQVVLGGAAGAGAGRMEENKAIMQMYQKTAELKAQPVEEYIQLLLDGGQKFLLFAHHTSLLDAAEHSCNKKKAKYIRIDGQTPASGRQQLVNKFQENEDIKVAILSIRAAGVGLTLTAASTVVFAEMSWTPGEIIQAEDRAHRIGQASSVNVYFLHVKNSIDDIIWASVQSKLENVGQALDGQDQSMEVTAVRHMPAHGQRSLDGFLSQATLQQQQQQEQARPGSTHVKSPSKSPSKAQPTLHAFFSGAKARAPAQEQQRQRPLHTSPFAQAQQQQQGTGPPTVGAQQQCVPQGHYQPPLAQQVQAHPASRLGPQGQQQYQQQQGASWGQGQVPLHAPSMHANAAGPTHQASHLAEQCQQHTQPGPGGAQGDALHATVEHNAAAGGRQNQSLAQQHVLGGPPTNAGWQYGGQENGGGAAGAGPACSSAVPYSSMVGVKRSYVAMQQQQPP